MSAKDWDNQDDGNLTEKIKEILDDGCTLQSVMDLTAEVYTPEDFVDALDELSVDYSEDPEYQKFLKLLPNFAPSGGYNVCATLTFETDNEVVINKLFGDCEREEENGKTKVVLKKIDYSAASGRVLKKVPKKYVSLCRLYSIFAQKQRKGNTGDLAIEAFYIDDFCEWLKTQLKVTLPKKYFTYTYSFWDQSRGTNAGNLSGKIRETAKYIFKNISVPSLKKYAEEAMEDIEESLSDYDDSEAEYNYCIQNGKRSYFRSGFGVETCLERLQDAFFGEHGVCWKPQPADLDIAFNAIYEYADDISIQKLRQAGIVPVFVSTGKFESGKHCASADAWFHNMCSGEEFSLWLDEIDDFAATLEENTPSV
ncbi:hypothetical protein Ruko_09320 [Ruthenibacterium sp. TH_2024_36131]|uniref:hypothetical protein n=1 Tax=Owariibacterium komagatae TaxID=3136601 RepID=UPI0038B3191D